MPRLSGAGGGCCDDFVDEFNHRFENIIVVMARVVIFEERFDDDFDGDCLDDSSQDRFGGVRSIDAGVVVAFFAGYSRRVFKFSQSWVGLTPVVFLVKPSRSSTMRASDGSHGSRKAMMSSIPMLLRSPTVLICEHLLLKFTRIRINGLAYIIILHSG